MSVELGALKEGIDDMDKKIEKMQKKTMGRVRAKPISTHLT